MRASTLFLLLPLFACAPPDGAGYFQQVDVRVADDEIDAALEFIPLIEGATESVKIALPHLDYGPLADALLAAHADSHIDVKFVTDVDTKDAPGTVALRDAGVPTRLADGAVTYFDFGITEDVRWTSEQVVMSHAFVVVDGLYTAVATSAGGQLGAPQVVVQMAGEVFAEDFTTEHNQLFGGSDATALTAFSAQAKSRADVRDIYLTDSDAPVEIYFGPQDRVTKRVIDAVYSARTSVRVLTNFFGNSGMNLALDEKANWGFPVEVIVGPTFIPEGVSRQFARTDAPISKLQVLDAADMPTIILIDIEGGPNVVPRAFVLSHDLYSAERLFGTTEVITDQLIDGNLLLLHDKDYTLGGDSESSLQPIIDVYMSHQARAGAL